MFKFWHPYKEEPQRQEAGSYLRFGQFGFSGLLMQKKKKYSSRLKGNERQCILELKLSDCSPGIMEQTHPGGPRSRAEVVSYRTTEKVRNQGKFKMCRGGYIREVVIARWGKSGLWPSDAI